ncbi:immunity 49 family protein [Rubrivirga marina]|uniref:Uncharacterized protein n=1 Tax=Rubrivirga marina TaxID=1196024 RepID=A0A271IXC7_9BACT|nr:immunity 49 family protein [Rubrivirga marina]PAP75737.1 hypothetical protein BSZ37_04425 [Rubrivirga marina]
MPSAPLPVAVERETRYANVLIRAANEAGRDEVGGAVYNELSERYRNIGVSFLLLDADLDAFAHCLIDSGITRRTLLRRGLPDEPEHAFRASFVDPVHDALAVGQLGLAAEIGRLSPATWYEDFEYEEDFVYAHLLFGLAQGADPAPLTALVDRHEVALRGVDDPRNAVCRALIARDEVAFLESFEAFVEAEAARIAEARVASYEFYDFQEVSVEGLALLKLAELAGLPTEREYRHCPAWARLEDYAPYVPQSFPEIALDA